MPSTTPRSRGVLDDRGEVSRSSAYAVVALLGVHPPDPAGGGVERPAHRGRADAGGEVDAGAR